MTGEMFVCAVVGFWIGTNWETLKAWFWDALKGNWDS